MTFKDKLNRLRATIKRFRNTPGLDSPRLAELQVRADRLYEEESEFPSLYDEDQVESFGIKWNGKGY